MKQFTILFTVLALAAVGCGEMEEMLGSHDGRLDNIETVQIKTINEQISGINASLTDLQKVDTDLQGLIDALETQASDLRSQLEANASSDASVKKAIESELQSLSALIVSLQEKDEELDDRISSLKTYVDSELKSSSDWVTSTFSTLEQYSEVQSEISGLKALLESHRSEITSSYQSAIASSISASESSMQTWVHSTLASGYYDIASIDGKVEYLKGLITSSDASLRQDLESLSSSLEQSRSDLTAAYEKAISDAIERTSGTLRGEIASSVNAALDKVEDELSLIRSSISAINDELALLHEDIATINEQISGINVSLTDLQKVDTDLQGLIDALETQASDLRSQLEANASSDASVKKAIESELQSLSALIVSLQEKDEELDDRISSLKTYVDSELKSSSDWVTSTFSTLEQYSEVQSEISGLKALLESHRSEITSSYQSAIASSISASESSMQTWVHSTLASGYYDIASIDGKVEYLKGLITSSDASLRQDLESLSSSLEQSRSDLTAAYEKAISDAIKSNNGYLDTVIKERIDAVNTEISTLASRIASVEDRLSGVEEKIAEILSMIQSVSYVPDHSDGMAYVNAESRTVELNFKISPSSALEALRDVWEDALTVKYVPTVLTKSIPQFADLVIKTVGFDVDSGVMNIIVDCSALDQSFFGFETGASIVLFISDGKNEVYSDFVPLFCDLDTISDVSVQCTAMSATVAGKLNVSESDIRFSQVLLYYSDRPFNINTATSVSSVFFDEQNGFTIPFTDLKPSTTYTFCLYAKVKSEESYSDIYTFTTESVSAAQDLSAEASANCYIVSQPGIYMFKTVKGNDGSDFVGDVKTCDVLWETLGTSEVPARLSVVNGAHYSDGYITFQIPDAFRKGNALIAAKDGDGKVLWSWHIWLTDKPEEQVYSNYAGTMMDRNLGATSIVHGDPCALGLLYQWGRKDPFLGASEINGNKEAGSSLKWPSPVTSNPVTGTIEYSVENPTTFIYCNDLNADWCYTGSSSMDESRWQSSKTIYDPCPAGWRVPDGGANGVWATAYGANDVSVATLDDDVNQGFDFSGLFGSDASIWYPLTGYRHFDDRGLAGAGGETRYWAVPASGRYAPFLHFRSYDSVGLAGLSDCGHGYSVRCMKEGSRGETDLLSNVLYLEDLSTSGNANCYIVSQPGTYMFKATKGNSEVSVGDVKHCTLLWETFGTADAPKQFDLIKGVEYFDGYGDGYIAFKTAETFTEGNAVIAAKDGTGRILWSWHIWMTDQPDEQIYANDAGIMMDRNLGATSAVPGDPGALGLLYQWGRKDPFLGSCSIDGHQAAASTVQWPADVNSDPVSGTVGYATLHPMTFVTGTNDWCYMEGSVVDRSRWLSTKTVNDPCPAGWRVPDGHADGVWAQAAGSSVSNLPEFDAENCGVNFGGIFGEDDIIWYPNAGVRSSGRGAPINDSGRYWSVTSDDGGAFNLGFAPDGFMNLLNGDWMSYAQSVRCMKD